MKQVGKIEELAEKDAKETLSPVDQLIPLVSKKSKPISRSKKKREKQKAKEEIPLSKDEEREIKDKKFFKQPTSLD